MPVPADVERDLRDFLREMRAERAEGYTLKRIADEVHEQGVRLLKVEQRIDRHSLRIDAVESDAENTGQHVIADLKEKAADYKEKGTWLSRYAVGAIVSMCLITIGALFSGCVALVSRKFFP